MKILAVDSSSVGQAQIARRIESFDPADLDSLDISVSLASEANFLDRCEQSDVLILGSGLGEASCEMARRAKGSYPNLEIILYVSDYGYSSGAFRAAHTAKARKVITDGASPLDLLQELVAIQEDLRSKGKARNGQIIAVVQAKGGVGATSIAAALGEVCSEHNRSTLLWDLDVESKDLSRSLKATGDIGRQLTAWINNSREITRGTLRDATVSLSEHVSILVPPHSLPAALDMVNHPDCVPVVDRIADLARVSFDNVVIDTAGRLSAAVGTLVRSADIVLVVIDDSVLGLTAINQFIVSLSSMMKGNLGAVRFLLSGTKTPLRELRSIADPDKIFGEEAWSLPAIPFEPNASKWPGVGKTLYSVCHRNVRKCFETIAGDIGMLSNVAYERESVLTVRESELATISDHHPFAAQVKKVANF